MIRCLITDDTGVMSLIMSGESRSEVLAKMVQRYPGRGRLGRWRRIHDECLKERRAIATLDLAVTDYTPLRLLESGTATPSVPKNLKPARARRKNV